MKDRLARALGSPIRWTPAERGLLEAIVSAAKGNEANSEEVRLALRDKGGKQVSDGTFQVQRARINDKLQAAAKAGDVSMAFRIGKDGDRLVIEEMRASEQQRLEERAAATDPKVSPTSAYASTSASPSIVIPFSYAWHDEGQQRIQVEFFKRVQRHIDVLRKLQAPNGPSVKLWRDEPDHQPHFGLQDELDAVFQRAPVLLAILSNRYPTRTDTVREFGFFVDEDGRMLPGKSVVIVPFDCRIDNEFKLPALERFWKHVGAWQFHEGRTLLESARRSESAKKDFAERIARRLLDALNSDSSIDGAAKTAVESAPLREPLDQPSPGRPSSPNYWFYAQQRALDVETPEASFAARHAMARSVIAPPADKADDERTVKIFDHLESWAIEGAAPRVVALLGDFGMGKTVTCREVVRRLAQRREKDSTGAPLPIYLDLSRIEKPKASCVAPLGALIEEMLRRPGEPDLDGDEVIRIARETSALVVFDGLDEVTNKLTLDEARTLYRKMLQIVPEPVWRADREAREALRTPAKDHRKRAPGRPRAETDMRPKGPRLIVSCRTHYFADLLGQRAFLTDRERAGLSVDEDIETWFLLPFGKAQIESYLERNLGKEAAGRALELIAETYKLEELVAQPVMLRFFSETFRLLEADKLAGRRIDAGRLYEVFIEQSLGRDLGKHIIGVRDKKRLLADLALHFHREGLNEIANDDLSAWLNDQIESDPSNRLLKRALEAAPRSGEEGEGPLDRFEVFVQDLRNATMLVRAGDKDFRFAHASMREYFLAEALHRHVRDGSLVALGGQTINAETVNFLLSRRARAEAREAQEFRKNIAAFIAAPTEGGASVDAHFRVLAARVILQAKGALPWPEIADFSGFAWHGQEFADRPGETPFPRRARWRNARLQNAKFFGRPFAGHDFTGADFRGAAFVDCDFSGAVWDAADLRAAYLRRCRSSAPLPANAKREGLFDVACAPPLAPLAAREAMRDALPALAKFSGPLSIAALSIEGRSSIAAGFNDGTILAFAADSGQALRVFQGHAGGVTCLAALDLDGRAVLASGGDDNTIRLWDARSGESLRVLQGHKGAVTSLAALDLDGHAVLASGGDDNTIRLWDARSGESLRVLQGHKGAQTSLAALDLDGHAVLASGGDDNTIRLWDARSGESLRVLQGHTEPVTSLAALDLDGRAVLASGGYDNTIRLWDARSGESLRVLQGHKGAVTSLAALDLDGHAVLASGGYDNTIRLWDARSGESLRVLQGHKGAVTSLAALDLDGHAVLASRGSNNTIRLWDARSGEQLHALQGHTGTVTSLAALDLDGHAVLASGGYDNTIRLWDARSGESLRVLQGHKGAQTSLAALDLDGHAVLASRGSNNTIRLWDARSGESLRVLQGHTEPVTSLAALDLDGRAVLASGGYDNTIRLWDARSGESLRVLQGHKGAVTSLAALDLDGHAVLASGGYDNTIRLWDARSGESLRVLQGHKGAQTSLAALDLDGHAVLASGGDDNTIRLWDARSGESLRVLQGHSDWVRSTAALDLDGRAVLASGSGDRSVRLWDVLSGDVLWSESVPFRVEELAFVGGSLFALGGRYCASFDPASLSGSRSQVRMRLLALGPDYTDSFIEIVKDAASGSIVEARIGENAWRDFLAVGRLADGRQCVRPIDDLAPPKS